MSQTHSTIPIWRTVVIAYRQGIGVVFRDRALFRYFIYASLLCLATYGANIYRARMLLSQSLSPGQILASTLAGLFLSFLFAVAICPFAFAVYRKLMLDETPREPYLAAVVGRGQRPFLLAILAAYGVFVLAAFVSHPILYFVYGVNPFDPHALARVTSTQPAVAFVVGGLTLIADLVAALVCVRFSFAFPAIALGAPGASLRQSVDATAGSTWRLFFIFSTIFAIAFVIVVVAIAAAATVFALNHPELARAPEAGSAAMAFSTPFLILYAVMFLAAMILVAVTAAATAHAYEIRVNGGLTGVVEVFA